MIYDQEAKANGNHAILLYRGRREYVAACAQYVKDGIADDAAILVAATRGHLDSLRSELSLADGDALACELTSDDADPGRVLSLIRMFIRANAGRPVRCVQDVAWLARPEEYLAEAIRYESLLSLALAGLSVDVLCCYDAERDIASLTAAERVHPVVLDGTTRRANPAFARSARDAQVARQTLSRPPDDASAVMFRSNQAEIRRFAAAQAREAGLPASRITDLLIAVGELAGNTLVHTSGAGTLTIWTTDEEIICQVSDSGQITDPLVGTLRPDPSEISSRRGLWLVHQVSDLVQVRTGSWGTTVRVHIRLAADGRTGPVPHESACGSGFAAGQLGGCGTAD